MLGLIWYICILIHLIHNICVYSVIWPGPSVHYIMYEYMTWSGLFKERSIYYCLIIWPKLDNYHGCWCPGPLHHHVISNHETNQTQNSQKTLHSSPSRARYGVSFVSILVRNDPVIRSLILFIFLENNSPKRSMQKGQCKRVNAI